MDISIIAAAVAAALLCGLANWIRGGLWGAEIIAALARADAALRLPTFGPPTPVEDGPQRLVGLLEIAWRSVGDKLLTTPAALIAAALLAGHPADWRLAVAWLLLYLGFVPGWPWIGMGRLNEDGTPEGWALSRSRRGQWLAPTIALFIGSPGIDASFWRRWTYDAIGLALRGLVVTMPAGAVLLDPWFALAGLAMPLAYEAGQHVSGRLLGQALRGTAAGELLFGALLGAALVLGA